MKVGRGRGGGGGGDPRIKKGEYDYHSQILHGLRIEKGARKTEKKRAKSKTNGEAQEAEAEDAEEEEEKKELENTEER